MKMRKQKKQKTKNKLFQQKLHHEIAIVSSGKFYKYYY